MVTLDNFLITPDKLKEKNWNIGQSRILNSKDYKKIHEELASIYNQERSDDWEEYSYQHAPLMQQFGDKYNNKLESITFGDEKTNKAYFYGEDFLIAKRSIDYYMLDKNYDKYNLMNGLNLIKGQYKKVMFKNVDCLDDGTLNDFRKKLWPLEINQNKIAIQGLQIDLDFYLDNYANIEIPDSKFIQSVISNIFVSLLREKNKLRGDVRLLYKVLKENGFFSFLKDLKYISQLKKIVDDINFVDVEDLLTASEFWIKLQEEISIINTDKNNLHEQQSIADIYTWKFIEEDGSWYIVKNGDVIITSKSNAFIYLVMILKYHETHDWKSIHGFVLQRAVQKYIGNDYKGTLKNAKPSGAWRVQKSYLKNKIDNPEIENFIDNHIKDIDEKILVIKKDKFKFSVNSKIRIDKNFFNDLNSDQELYK